MDPGVNLYSRKVLVEAKSPDVLPEWMRFVKGVVDSEDLPLAISRERMQDSRLLVKIREVRDIFSPSPIAHSHSHSHTPHPPPNSHTLAHSQVLTGKLIRFIAEKQKKERKEYEEFFAEFGHFLKEGCCTDFANKDKIAATLLFESSKCDPGELTSMDEYISRCGTHPSHPLTPPLPALPFFCFHLIGTPPPHTHTLLSSPSARLLPSPGPDQMEVYYLIAPTREMAMLSPYYEAFKKSGEEVLFMYTPIDDFVMNNLQEFNKRKLVSADSAANKDSVQAKSADEKEEDAGTKKEEVPTTMQPTAPRRRRRRRRPLISLPLSRMSLPPTSSHSPLPFTPRFSSG
jgi:HSP90 family molecular chaperone